MKKIPFFLYPSAKDYLWGGTRLNDEYNYNISINPFAEAWVCSCHPDGESVISSNHKPLSEVLKQHPTWLGTHSLAVTGGKAELPILIKIIDAKMDLSVQVHPDDAYALKHENCNGKSEMWYVLDAKPGTELIYGFNQNVTPLIVKKALEQGKIDRYLNHISVSKDDVFYIEAGTVHAIGNGALIAEIQENSNITYRRYDYDRIDKDGNKRCLHIDKALEVANLYSSAAPRQPMRVLRYKNGCATELLSRCKYFQVERMLINTETHRELVEYKTASNSFHVFFIAGGCGSISSGGFMINFFKGDCVFIPADSDLLKIHGRAQILDVSC